MDVIRFEREWQAHSRAVANYCVFSTGSREDGEDIAAEVFSRLLGTGRRIRPDKTEAWLFTVARNLCISHHRSAARGKRLLERLSTDPRPAVVEAWRRPEVWEHVRELNERSRLAIYLRVAEDRPFAEVAQLMGVSESAAKMTYYRALHRLRTNMIPEVAPGTTEPAGGVSNAE